MSRPPALHSPTFALLPAMTDPIEGAFQELQREYLTAMPVRLEELKSDLAGIRSREPEAATSLRTRLHRLAGSGGSYGFREVSSIAREAERWLADHPSPEDAAGLEILVERLAAAIGSAQAQLATAPLDPATIPRALLIMRPGPERERIAQELKSVGYQVGFGSRQDHPATVPADELPHLLVIGGEAGDGDPSAVASAWTGDLRTRPGAVVLVETLRAVDRLRAVAAGVDAVFPADQVHQKLPPYARAFARIGPPPSSVLLVQRDPGLASQITRSLEEAAIKVVRCLDGKSVQEAMERQVPDALLFSTQLEDFDAFALTRLVRQDIRHQLLPIIFIGGNGPGERIAALRAGADDFLLTTAEPELLAQTVIARATRGRRLREMVHRDGLTGLLNHATLTAELENAVDYSRRNSEPLAFLLFELEGFRQLGERLGPRVAGEVLLHMAGVFRSNVRASDVIGRYGTDAFGMLLRGASATGAQVLADKLRRVLGEQPAQTTGGERIQLPVSVATAVFPRDGVSGGELAQAAERAVRKAGKR